MLGASLLTRIQLSPHQLDPGDVEDPSTAPADADPYRLQLAQEKLSARFDTFGFGPSPTWIVTSRRVPSRWGHVARYV